MTVESIEKLRKLPYHGTNGFGNCVTASKETIDSIADEIEEEISERYMPLPLDADGVTIRIGDMLENRFSDYGCLSVHGYTETCALCHKVPPADLETYYVEFTNAHHVKPRTIEDVLEEFGSKMHGITTEERERLVNEAADEIRGMK